MQHLRCLITGATGCLGSHVAEACLQRGWEVVTIARPSSDVRLLEQLGVTIVRGDLNDERAIREATANVDVVIHCAAKVGDWGPVEEFRAVNVGGLQLLLDAVKGKKLRRFVHLSSLGVYEARDHFRTDETVPPPAKQKDGYTQSKVECEALALQYHKDAGVPVTILRPGFIYGPRDRTVLPRLLDLLRRKDLIYVGDGSKALNTIGVHNLTDAVLLAVEKPAAIGQTYNLTDDEPVSKRRFLEALADLSGFQRPHKWIPLWVAKMLTPIIENSCRLIKLKVAPRLTQGRLKFIALNLDFSVEKAKRELGYQPRVKFEDGIEEAVAWWKEQREAELKAREKTLTAVPQQTVVQQ
jgi:nucleoside-diphosphate-sugar epimerase